MIAHHTLHANPPHTRGDSEGSSSQEPEEIMIQLGGNNEGD